ncbi:MAG: hypothetical protein AVDCRST_MAG55-1440, partial [uncultured Rubrobacteraceae bacterium]
WSSGPYTAQRAGPAVRTARSRTSAAPIPGCRRFWPACRAPLGGSPDSGTKTPTATCGARCSPSSATPGPPAPWSCGRSEAGCDGTTPTSSSPACGPRSTAWRTTGSPAQRLRKTRRRPCGPSRPARWRRNGPPTAPDRRPKRSPGSGWRCR